MRRRDWWIGVAVVVVALAAHTLVPRYEWAVGPVPQAVIRIDRWTGSTSVWAFNGTGLRPLLRYSDLP
jgi:hypothetical protein